MADRAGLEIQCGVTPTEGSNPSLSALARCPKLLTSDFGQRRFRGGTSGILPIGKLDHLRRVCSLFRSCGASLRHDQILSHSRQNRHILNNRCDDEIPARVTSLVGSLLAFQ